MRALVALDIFEPGHEELLAQAAQWAQRMNATLDAGYVDGMSYVGAPVLDAQLKSILDAEMEKLKASREGQLQALVDSLPEAIRGTAQYRYEFPALETFVSMADDYDVVLIGTHGRTGMSRFFLGSFAEKVVRLCKVPTLVLRLKA